MRMALAWASMVRLHIPHRCFRIKSVALAGASKLPFMLNCMMIFCDYSGYEGSIPKENVYCGMISTKSKSIYEQSSRGWAPSCLVMLIAMEHLESRGKTLEDKLAVNSRNSSYPPSQDGFKKPPPKPKSLCEKSGKKPGG